MVIINKNNCLGSAKEGPCSVADNSGSVGNCWSHNFVLQCTIYINVNPMSHGSLTRELQPAVQVQCSSPEACTPHRLRLGELLAFSGTLLNHLPNIGSLTWQWKVARCGNAGPVGSVTSRRIHSCLQSYTLLDQVQILFKQQEPSWM